MHPRSCTRLSFLLPFALALVLLLMALFIPDIAVSETLAVICDNWNGKATGVELPTDPAQCTGGNYNVPIGSDIVRVGKGWSGPEPYVLRRFNTLSVTDTIDACVTPGVLRGQVYPSPWDAAKDPCKQWAVVLMTTFFTVVPINTTGNFHISWDPVALNKDGSPCTDLIGYWVYSAGEGATLTRLKQIAAPTTFLDVTGYSVGKYRFAVTALSPGGESDMSGEASSEVIAAKVPQAVKGVKVIPVKIP